MSERIWWDAWGDPDEPIDEDDLDDELDVEKDDEAYLRETGYDNFADTSDDQWSGGRTWGNFR